MSDTYKATWNPGPPPAEYVNGERFDRRDLRWRDPPPIDPEPPKVRLTSFNGAKFHTRSVMDMHTGITYPSLVAAELASGCSKQNIYGCAKKNRAGCRWQYIENAHGHVIGYRHPRSRKAPVVQRAA